MAEIYIPKNIPELFILCEQMLNTHEAMGTDSPLQRLDLVRLKCDLKKHRSTFEEYNRARIEFERLRDELQLAFGVHRNERQLKEGTVRYVVVQARDILKAIHRNELQILKEWGFDLIEKEESKK